MPNPWLGIDVGTDPLVHARRLRGVWEDFLGGAAEVADLRGPISVSWQRSIAAGAPHTGEPELHILSESELGDRRERHALRRVLPFVHRSLLAMAEESQHLIAVSDADGRLLWIDGDPHTRDRAAPLSFVEGALWSEEEAGTNAVGTAIAFDHAVQVFASEHFNEGIHRWACAAAPVHDPVTGDLIGVIDVTSVFDHAHPHSLAVASATAAAIESQLRVEQRERAMVLRERHIDELLDRRAAPRALVDPQGRVLVSEPREWMPDVGVLPLDGGELTLPDGTTASAEPIASGAVFIVRAQRRDGARRHGLELVTLGRDRGLARVAGRELQLSQRHTELLVLLVLNPEGKTAEQLAAAIYGDAGRPSTVRTEVFRLRKLLGPWIEPEPYRLTLPVDADFAAVERLLRRGLSEEAARRYVAPLLPRSEAPGIVAARDELEIWIRSAVMGSDDREVLWAWLQTASGRDDMPAWRRFVADVEFDDPRRSQAAGRLAALRESLATAG